MIRALGRMSHTFFGLCWTAMFVVFCASDWTPDRPTIAAALALAAAGHFLSAVRD